jgi:hypothetical protein
MVPEGTKQIVRTSLVLGVQFDEFDLRLFLRDYHRALRERNPSQSFPAYSPQTVLDSLIERYEEDCSDERGGGSRYEALRRFAHETHRLDLCMTTSDYGPLDRRESPYSYDRAFYHLGRELVSAELEMDFPGYNPYRSTRRLNVLFVRENVDDLLEFLPDYLWWEMHDQADVVRNCLVPEQLAEVRRRIELSGFKLDSFGLYLTNLETLALPPDES